MASTKEIKNHINSVRDTQKITNAMYLISSTKLTKAKREWDHTRPFFQYTQKEIKRIFRTAPNLQSRYFYPSQDEPPLDGTYGCLVITADKGLAGSYNMNVIKEAEKLLNKHKDTKLFVVGEYGRRYFMKHHIPIEQSFLYTAQNPTMDRAREICSMLLDFYDQEKLEKIYVVYTDMSGIEQQAKVFRLLPFHRFEYMEEDDLATDFEFNPSLQDVLEKLMPSYIAGFIYSALVDSFCSEQNARMSAMNSANQNAEKILAELKVEYNRVRQAAITQEITEISAGAKAQRDKRKKREVQDEHR
ncbi:ATP synthase F1 subunit gamma [Floccifex sp.]|uniref:ATP synthase F1 subunit gamma n=1 Tax=Floccifex sp. TaxID=2815810 RepID=UPI002A75BCF6|nr:ATP synthase F1 subunit gamma [Floccifex sp.]MDD7281233.1 ATP synthase F1 subunit gamma [Erysipelotrichaceae bacterium]MDY2958229.1 ATP synthase F1 subunit gamma [Floccifex sp.]